MVFLCGSLHGGCKATKGDILLCEMGWWLPTAVFQADSVNRYQAMMNFISLGGSLAEKQYFRHQIVKVVDYKSRNINHLWEALKM